MSQVLCRSRDEDHPRAHADALRLPLPRRPEGQARERAVRGGKQSGPATGDPVPAQAGLAGVGCWVLGAGAGVGVGVSALGCAGWGEGEKSRDVPDRRP